MNREDFHRVIATDKNQGRLSRLRGEELFDRYDEKQLKRFVVFHSQNPHIFKHFLRIAREMQTAGWKKSSGTAVIQIIRWDLRLKTDTIENYRISNLFVSMYVRLSMVLFPEEFSTFFDIFK